MIPNDFIQTLLGRVDIVEVIDRLVPLKKAGSNYVACCPFHREKTPSFTVSPSKQFYHCFGCGAHGTAIGFLMEYAGKPFVEAVEELARNAGLTVPRTGPDRAEQGASARIAQVLLDAAKFYKRSLKASTRAVEYLRGRGLTGQIAAHFGIGYAPPGWQSLAEVVDDYDDPALEQSGLVIVGDGGRRYDRFRDRITFPILDSRGQVIGFGGRVIDAGEPKYLNSPETALFSKGRELYGLFQARQAIRDSGTVLVVEGYMDVVALAQHGIENVVATLGTATTPIHAAKLLRHADTVVFCFDGDEAGRRAAWRGMESSLAALTDGKEVRFVFLPEGLDPDDYVRAHGAEGFRTLAAEGRPLSEFLMQELVARHPPTTAEGKAGLVAAARPFLEQLAAPVLAALLRQRLAELTGLAASAVPVSRAVPRAAAAGTGATSHSAAHPAAPAAPHAGPHAAEHAQAERDHDRARNDSGSTARKPAHRRPLHSAPVESRLMLKALLAHPPLAAQLTGRSWPQDDPEGRALAAVLALQAESGSTAFTTAGVLETLRDTEHAQLLWEIAAQVALERLDPDAAGAEVEALLARAAAREERDQVRALLARGELGRLTAEERERLSRFRRAEQMPGGSGAAGRIAPAGAQAETPAGAPSGAPTGAAPETPSRVPTGATPETPSGVPTGSSPETPSGASTVAAPAASFDGDEPQAEI